MELIYRPGKFLAAFLVAAQLFTSCVKTKHVDGKTWDYHPGVEHVYTTTTKPDDGRSPLVYEEIRDYKPYGTFDSYERRTKPQGRSKGWKNECFVEVFDDRLAFEVGGLNVTPSGRFKSTYKCYTPVMRSMEYQHSTFPVCGDVLNQNSTLPDIYLEDIQNTLDSLRAGFGKK